MNAPSGPSGASFYALGPEFEWLAAAWDGFARDLAETSGMLRHIVSVAAADPAVAAESSGLAALESATDRLVRELVDDAARIRRTLATYEQADATVHASATTARGPLGEVMPPRIAASTTATPRIPAAADAGPSPTHTAAQPSSPQTTMADDPQTARPTGAPEASAPAWDAQEDAPQASTPSSRQTQEIPRQVLWHPDPADPTTPAGNPADTQSVMIGALSRVRRDMLARAEHWINQQIPYNQEAWHEGYRTDCSGYVSMCWGLRDSYVTSTIPQISHHIPKDQLRAGDALVNTDVQTGHVVMFDRWADYAHNSYVGFELTPAGTHHHVIPYPYFSGFGDFEPYRYNNAGD